VAVAGRNREALGLTGLVELCTDDLLAGVPAASLRLVVSNPPYIRSADIAGLAPDVRDYEPAMALDGGADGLDVYRRLLPEAARVLLPGGTVLVEVGDGQAQAVADLAAAAGLGAIEIHKDLSGKCRIVEAARPGAKVLLMEELSGAEIDALAAALRAGGAVGLPTDTVYGIAAAWDSREGVRRLFLAKGRAEVQPVAVLFPSVQAVRERLPDLDVRSAQVLEALLPGPFTFVVRTAVPRPSLVGTEDSLGVRVPDHPPLLRLLEALDIAVAATSANPSGQSPAATLEEVAPDVLAHCSVALGTGEAVEVQRTASTVVDLRPLATGDQPRVLREGAVRGEEVLARIASLG
jgi:tRNA threonylcarbamoyl adenosine modification protein (Sua5/YciO/YrdC/YwlC family)